MLYPDAEYYLVGRFETSVKAKEYGLPKRVIAAGGVFLSGVYSIGKIANIVVGREEANRTDKPFPNAPPGGEMWAGAGAEDAFQDTGKIQDPAPLVTPPSERLWYG